MSTRTYVLEGKQYTVPADTSMDELDQYIRGQSFSTPDANAQAKQRLQAIPQEQKPSNLENVLTGPPLMAAESGLPSAAQVPENRKAMEIGAAIGAPIGGTIAGGIRALPFIARSILGATAGSSLGGYGGREVGGIFGPKGREVGGQLGATVGGLAGGYTAARGGTVPGKGTMLERIFGGGAEEPSYIPASKSPGPYRGPSSVPKPPKPAPEVDPVVQAVKNRTASWIPTKMPQQPIEGDPVAQAVKARQANWIPTKMPSTEPEAQGTTLPGVRGGSVKVSSQEPLVMTPEEWARKDQLMSMTERMAKERGMQYAAGVRTAGPNKAANRLFPTPQEPIPQGNPTPFEAPKAPIQVQTDSLGVRWAHDGTNKVSIPRSVPDESIEEYARPKLAEQAQIRSQLPWMRGQS